MSTLHEWARWYHDRGLSVFPCRPRDKRPLLQSWLPYQTQPCTLDELDTWWSECPHANIAIATGRGLLVVDFDGEGAEDLLYEQAGVSMPDKAPRVKTGNGEHVYLAIEKAIGNKAALVAAPSGKPAVDIRGDGGYVLAPPSIHPNTGLAYEWLVPFEGELPPAPQRLLDLIGAHKENRNAQMGGAVGEDWVSQLLAGVPEGQRDFTCARLAGFFLRHALPPDVVLAVLADFAARCTPPFPMREVQRVVRSIAQREAANGADPDTAEQIRPVAEPIGVVVQQALEAIQAGPMKHVPTGFGGLNRMASGGFHPGELVYLGARPGMGKTAFALEVTCAAAKAGQTVLFVSCEMRNVALVRRMLAQQGKLSAAALKRGFITDWHPVMETAKRLAGLPIWLSDTASNVADIRAGMEAVPQAVDFLVVDYLQLIRAPRGVQERRHQVEAISKSLKSLAMQCGIPVLCLSSLSRPSEGKERLPRLADLRESGELEHDADIVLFLHREKGSEETTCIVAKNRDGETGDVNLVFRPEFVSFSEAADAAYYPEDYANA